MMSHELAQSVLKYEFEEARKMKMKHPNKAKSYQKHYDFIIER